MTKKNAVINLHCTMKDPYKLQELLQHNLEARNEKIQFPSDDVCLVDARLKLNVCLSC